MPLSTSSFEDQLGMLPWLRIVGLSVSIFFAFVGAMEGSMVMLNYHPTVLDSMDKWIYERGRADQLGNRALVLLGASRIQLGIDTDILRRETGLEPVQLAVDGSSFVPTLRGLANDPSFVGTVILDYAPNVVEGAISGGGSEQELFERHYESELKRDHAIFSLNKLEAGLTQSVREHLRSYADGATPVMSLLTRVIPREASGQYLGTLPDRSRFADYKMVAMPSFYFARVARNLGIEKTFNSHAANAEQILRAKIDSIGPRPNAQYLAGTRYLKTLKEQIEARGGTVLIIEMPTSGMVREIDLKEYPKADFLDQFQKEIGTSVLVSEDNPVLQKFVCPDGSHLDLRDKSAFTATLAHVLALDKKKG